MIKQSFIKQDPKRQMLEYHLGSICVHLTVTFSIKYLTVEHSVLNILVNYN